MCKFGGFMSDNHEKYSTLIEKNPVFKIDPKDIKEILSQLNGINTYLASLNLIVTSMAISNTKSMFGIEDELMKISDMQKKYNQFLTKTFGEGYER